MSLRRFSRFAGAIVTFFAISVSSHACKPAAEGDDARLRRKFIKDLMAAEEGGKTAWELSLNEDVHFAEGFCIEEIDHRDRKFIRTFRRMGHHGVVRLKTHGASEMKLTLSGRAPKHPSSGKPVVSLAVQGDFVDSFVLDTEKFEHVTMIPGALLAARPWVDLSISLSTWGDGMYGDCQSSVTSIEGMEWTAP